MPATIVAIAITVDTPITTPRIVRLERPFAAASELRAEPTFSGNLRAECATDRSVVTLVGPHRGNRIEARRARRRIHAENHSHAGAEAQREEDRPRGDPCRKR